MSKPTTKESLATLSVEDKRRLVAELMRTKGAAASKPAVSRPAAAPPPAPRRAPLSSQQQRLWLLEQLSPGTSAYNIPIGMMISGRFDAAGWRRAFRAAIGRHDVLRSAFRVDGEPYQVVAGDAAAMEAAGVREASFDHLPREEARRQALELFERMAAEPFDLGQAPPWRAALARIADDQVLFVFVVHHIVFDGWSSMLFVNDLLGCYRLALRGVDAELSPLPLQYGDFARWQRRALSGEALDGLLDYWRETLDGVARQELPTDRPRPSEPTQAGAHLMRELSPERTVQLKEFARRHGAITNMVLVAAVQLLLARTCSQRDIVVGSSVIGRPRTELEKLVGFFVNTLALRTDVDPDLDFAGLVRRVRGTVQGAMAHQDMPFERLVQELDIERVPNRHPIFQVCLNHLQVATTGASLPEATLEFLETTDQSAKFDLLFDFRELPTVLRINVSYNREIFDRETIEAFADRFERLLFAGLDAPETRLRDLPFASEDELRRVAGEWSLGGDHSALEPVADTLVDRLARWVRETPEAVALVEAGVESGEEERRLTYGALGRRATRVGHRLRREGVGLGDFVGVAAGRGADLVVALAGVLQAGAAYVPLDPEYPAERLRLMVEDAGLRVILCDGASEALARALSSDAVIVRVDRADDGATDATADETYGPLVEGLDASQAANLIFTSGSTGRPKGTVVPHRGIVRLVTDGEHTDLEPSDRVAQLASISFDAATFEIWTALAHGAALVVVPREDLLDPERLRTHIEEQGITTMLVITAPFHQLVKADPTLFRGVRRLFFGGETADPKLVRSVVGSGSDGSGSDSEASAGAPERLVHSYGPTESTVIATWLDVRHVPEDAASIPIGRPVAGTRAYVVDPWLRPMPVGVPGELVLGGDGLALGYHERPELTAERFVPDPFVDSPDARLYRTGDRVRWTRDGLLEFLGRVDHQVKIRGHRIELGEIESSILEHAEVREAVVVLRDGAGGPRIAAYWSGAESLDSETLSGRLRRRLPSYMVPSLTRLDALPINANGKVDRRALPEPTTDLLAFVEPRTETERILVRVWSEVLERPDIGIHDDFFALGGHSLLAVQLVSRVRDELEVPVSVRHLLEAPTVASLAASLEGLQATALPPIERVEEGDSPLSFAQERMWFLEQMLDGQALYTIPIVLGLEGELDVEALEGAIAAVLETHEALRTVIVAGDGSSAQTRHEAAGATQRALPIESMPTLERIDLTGRDSAGRATTELARHEVLKALRTPFRLDREPPFRALLLELGPRSHQLAVFVHHIAVDGWSVDLLLRDLAAAYGALRAGRRPALSSPRARYADYAAWQRRHHDALVADDLEHWTRVYPEPPPVLELPTDRPRPARPSHRAAAEPVRLTDGVEALREIGANEGATPFMAVLALFQTLLYRLSGQTRFAVGSPVAGRELAELEDVVGLFVNTVAFPADLDGRPTFRQLLRRVRDAARGALAHQALPFDRLVDALQPERATDRSPIVQVMLSLHGARSGEPTLDGLLDGLEVTIEEQRPEAVELDLVLGLTETDAGYEGGFTYATDLFDRETIVRFRTLLQRLLTQVVADPDRSIDELELVDATERAHLLALGTEPALPAPASPLDLIDHRVDQAPEAPAVAGRALDGSTRTLSYGALRRTARSIAARLVDLGVTPGTRVGVAARRSPEMVAALLGVLEAGAAFVPMDPAFPEERLRLLAGDALRGQATALVLVDDAERWGSVVRSFGSVVRSFEGSVEGGLRAIELGSLVDLDADAADSAAADDAALELPSRDPQRPAYVLYTSGTTGKPKGVIVPHRALAAQLAWLQELRPQAAGDAMLQRTSLSFDVAIEEIFWPLAAGARVELAPPDADPWQLVEHMRSTGVSVLNVVPSLLRVLLDVPGFARLDALHTILCGGEELRPELVRRVAEAFRARVDQERPALFNMYGPTETTITAVGGQIADQIDGRVPLGRPVAGMQALVLDRNLRLVPHGAWGELCLSGPQLALGYLDRPQLTAERFVDSPFGEGRLYRTGDRVRWRDDGRLEFAGRLDDQVKLRGIRIEPGEIEATLLALPEHSVTEAAVGLETVAGEPQLVARVVMSPDAEAGAADRDTRIEDALRRALQERLPSAWVPSIVQSLDALPRLASGKLDRRALPPIERALTVFEPPRDALERQIAEVWAEVLGLRADDPEDDHPSEELVIGRRDDFFALGGHSLLAARVVARLRDALEIDLSVRDLLESPTLDLFADTLRRRRLQGERALPELVPSLEAGPHRASLAQEWLWPRASRGAGRYAHHVPMVLELTGPVDAEALERALREIVERHEVLRGRLQEVDEEVHLHVGPGLDALPRHDLSTASHEELDAWLLDEARRPFDLGRDPMLRAALVSLAPQRHLLLVVTHHIASDGLSHTVFLTELAALYDAFAHGLPSPLEPLPVQYADFARWQRALVADGRLEAGLDYWRGQLTDLPATELPLDRPRPAADGPEMSTWVAGGWSQLGLDASTVSALRRLAGAQGATLFMAIVAAWQSLLYREAALDAARRIAVGTPISQRPLPELERMIGLFMQNLPLVTEIDGDASFRTLLERARETVLGAFAHQDVPFARLAEDFGGAPHPYRAPLVQSQVVFYHGQAGRLALPGLEVAAREIDTGSVKTDLILSLSEDGDRLRGAIGFRHALFDRSTADALGRRFVRLLEAAVADPDAPLAALPIDPPSA